MILKIQGITEEQYGLWCNGGAYDKYLEINDNEEAVVTKIGFYLEDIKNFDLDLTQTHHAIFVKVHNDKTYDIYREHLITLIKMMILNKKNYQASIFMVSDKNHDYKNELTNFFNLNTHYENNQRYGEYLSIIKCLSMRFIGFTITNFIIKFNGSLQSLIKKK
ncbi:hypothetical protein [Rosenbergiella nectarea]|uniref:hypothetical protein n=1 Tax=Rosenbergiella nectarea TaxID=988801 RepID=UPI001BD98D43|nr:hypothetical protein [Rosenbergiella nectarea]MBT0730379.1 hypothetical protein [Rosenbergiella nectarea subsp. apis]